MEIIGASHRCNVPLVQVQRPARTLSDRGHEVRELEDLAAKR